jgi:aryl-alcohol dehydrogenase
MEAVMNRSSASAVVVRSLGGEFAVESVSVDAPRADELLVRIVAVGICHTDLSARDGTLPFGLPAVLGHEGSGVVEVVGEAVTGFEVGDHVVLSGAYCGHCPVCMDGNVVYCPSFPVLSRAGRRPDGSATVFDADDQPLNGTFVGQSSFATRMLVRAVNAVKVSTNAPLELLGPLGCGVMTGAGGVLDTLRPPAGSTLAVFGLGGVGMSAVLAARLAGCGRVVAVDVNPSRLALALELGATDAVNVSEVDAIAAIQQLTGRGVDFAVEASGVAAVGVSAVESTHGQGATLLLGAPPVGAELKLPWTSVLRGRTVRGAIMGGANPRHFIPRIVDFMAQGRFPLDRLVTFFPLDAVADAVEALESGTVVKPVLLMPSD